MQYNLAITCPIVIGGERRECLMMIGLCPMMIGVVSKFAPNFAVVSKDW